MCVDIQQLSTNTQGTAHTHRLPATKIVVLVEAHCGLFIHMKVEAHCGASLLGFVTDHRVVMILQVPREALEFAGMSINFCSGKFGYSICPIFSKGHAEIFREF